MTCWICLYSFHPVCTDASARSEPEDDLLSVLCLWTNRGRVSPWAPWIRARGANSPLCRHPKQQQSQNGPLLHWLKDGELFKVMKKVELMTFYDREGWYSVCRYVHGYLEAVLLLPNWSVSYCIRRISLCSNFSDTAVWQWESFPTITYIYTC